MSETFFAPAKRTEKVALQDQIQIISNSSILDAVLKIMPGVVVVLNEDRQIVGLNYAFLESFGIDNPEKSLGLRLGESVGCIHADTMAGGCGTSRSCSSCGAVVAMMATIKENVTDEQVCALAAHRDGKLINISLLVHTSPLVLEGETFVVVVLRDITQEQFRANVERVFYHDMNNMLTSLLGSSALLQEEMPTRWDVMLIHESAKRLHREIALQSELCIAGGADDFAPDRQQVEISAIHRDIELLMHGHSSARSKTVEMSNNCEDCQIYTDKLLVSRVLANMLINALEATAEGGTVKFTTTKKSGCIVWQVWNNSFIPLDIQSRIFQRHFSTKVDKGHGLGTFSMKLFGEMYLKGKIDFTSTEAEGTFFTFTLPLL
ncbi:MAG: HAMP domain-containing histidine kinase [Desulfobulbaceae bacterium]|nr:HAMP domain-containing histidine kinase [Desulfobulbaceae bacterium]